MVGETTAHHRFFMCTQKRAFSRLCDGNVRSNAQQFTTRQPFAEKIYTRSNSAYNTTTTTTDKQIRTPARKKSRRKSVLSLQKGHLQPRDQQLPVINYTTTRQTPPSSQQQRSEPTTASTATDNNVRIRRIDSTMQADTVRKTHLQCTTYQCTNDDANACFSQLRDNPPCTPQLHRAGNSKNKQQQHASKK